jgi:ATP dependent DNA ligase domain
MRPDDRYFVICFSVVFSSVFIAFDLLYLNGKDLRTLPLIDRKAMLKKLLRRKRSRILFLDHVESDGRLMFDQILGPKLVGPRPQHRILIFSDSFGLTRKNFC